MKLPGFKSIERQEFLWDSPMGNHGHARTVLGDFAEDLTAKMLRGRRYRTDCRAEYCPDVMALGAYFECKSAGRTNQTFVYAGRLEKDRRFSSTRPLFYAIWHHSAKTAFAASEHELKAAFLASLKAVYFVPFIEIDRLAIQSGEPTPLNSKYGHSDTNPIYGSGYRIPISRIREAQHLELTIKHLRRQRLLFEDFSPCVRSSNG